MKKLTGFDFEYARKSGRHKLQLNKKAAWVKHLKPDNEMHYFDPVFSVTSPDADIVAKLGRFNALASKKAPWGGTSFYSLTRPTADLLRGTAEVSGVHIYNKSGDFIRANESFVMIHATGDGRKELLFDQEYILTDIISGKKTRAKQLSLDLKNGDTIIYHTEKVK